MTCMLRFHSEISKCVMENLCVLLMKTHNVGDLFPPAFFGKNALYVTSMKTRDVEDLFPPASFGEDALCVACTKTRDVEDLFPTGITLRRCRQSPPHHALSGLVWRSLCIFFMFHVV